MEPDTERTRDKLVSTSNRLYKVRDDLHAGRASLPWGAYFREIVARDAVLRIAAVLAVLSCVVVRPPLAVYAEYIDFKTLACLASLMTATGGFMLSGLFDRAAAGLAARCGSSRTLVGAMVFGTFFSSMVITNDVALIVFVPMALIALRRADIDPIPTVVLQTIAANVGSILLPVGNPQNLYLYSRYQMAFVPFLRTVAPLCLAGGALLLACCLCLPKKSVLCPPRAEVKVRGVDVLPYAALFLVAVLAVFGAVDYRVAAGAALAMLLIKGRDLAQQVDFALLATFIGFFVFVGNVSHIPEIERALTLFVRPRPYFAAVLASQFISNVPAAVLLSGFTAESRALLAGVSAGGCGTLIASMASLISYKLFVRSDARRRRYLTVFTLANAAFLAVMTLAYLCFVAA